jgi:hypothetical protein
MSLWEITGRARETDKQVRIHVQAFDSAEAASAAEKWLYEICTPLEVPASPSSEATPLFAAQALALADAAHAAGAAALAQRLRTAADQLHHRETLVLVCGDRGPGRTALVRALAEAASIPDPGTGRSGEQALVVRGNQPTLAPDGSSFCSWEQPGVSLITASAPLLQRGLALLDVAGAGLAASPVTSAALSAAEVCLLTLEWPWTIRAAHADLARTVATSGLDLILVPTAPVGVGGSDLIREARAARKSLASEMGWAPGSIACVPVSGELKLQAMESGDPGRRADLLLDSNMPTLEAALERMVVGRQRAHSAAVARQVRTEIAPLAALLSQAAVAVHEQAQRTQESVERVRAKREELSSVAASVEQKLTARLTEAQSACDRAANDEAAAMQQKIRERLANDSLLDQPQELAARLDCDFREMRASLNERVRASMSDLADGMTSDFSLAHISTESAFALQPPSLTTSSERSSLGVAALAVGAGALAVPLLGVPILALGALSRLFGRQKRREVIRETIWQAASEALDRSRNAAREAASRVLDELRRQAIERVRETVTTELQQIDGVIQAAVKDQESHLHRADVAVAALRQLDEFQRATHQLAETSMGPLPADPPAPSFLIQPVPPDDATIPSDAVAISAFAPPEAVPGQSLLVQTFLHCQDQDDAAQREALRRDRTSVYIGCEVLETELSRGMRVTIHLSMSQARIDEPVQSFLWQGKLRSVSFVVKLSEHSVPGPLLAAVIVSADGVPLGQLKFTLQVVAPSLSVKSIPNQLGDEARNFRNVFISYASEDRAKVIARVQTLKALKIRFFQDRIDLEPGDEWMHRIYDAIDKSDAFFLFWSSAAKRSQWVEREWRRALARQAGDPERPPRIVPMIIEGPPPVPPPEELNYMNFADYMLYMIYAEGGDGSPRAAK